MTLKQAIKIVEQYQKWRRDTNVHSRNKMPHPTDIGKALDILIIVAKDYKRIYNMDRVKIKKANKK